MATPGYSQLSDLISTALARGPGVGIFGSPGYFRTLPESTWSCSSTLADRSAQPQQSAWAIVLSQNMTEYRAGSGPQDWCLRSLNRSAVLLFGMASLVSVVSN